MECKYLTPILHLYYVKRATKLLFARRRTAKSKLTILLLFLWFTWEPTAENISHYNYCIHFVTAICISLLSYAFWQTNNSPQFASYSAKRITNKIMRNENEHTKRIISQKSISNYFTHIIHIHKLCVMQHNKTINYNKWTKFIETLQTVRIIWRRMSV